ELAKLDTNQFYIELTEAQAAFEVAQANYNKLLAGSSPEEIKVAETTVLNTEVSLENAKQNLKDVEADAEEDLKQAYENAFDTLDAAFLRIYNAFSTASDVQKTYFTSNDQEGIKVRDNKDKIQGALNQANNNWYKHNHYQTSDSLFYQFSGFLCFFRGPLYF
ncbi:unnamed protein product, partial [marine sediment metagenome]